MLFIPVDFRHRPEKIVKSHDSLIELVLVTYRAYRSTRKGEKKKKTNQEKVMPWKRMYVVTLMFRITFQTRTDTKSMNSAWKVQQVGHASCNIN